MSQSATSLASIPVYRVRNWQERFESAKSRTYKIKSQTYMPNKQGVGYLRIMREPDGVAIYGAWCAMVGFLSRQEGPRQGYLTDTGKSGGEPYDPDTLAMLLMVPSGIVRRMVDFCSSDSIRWLEVARRKDTTGILPGIPRGIADGPLPLPSPSPLPLVSTPPPPKGGGVSVTDEGFDWFWKAYPKKLAKGDARKAWVQTRKARPPADELVAVVEAQKATADWKKNGGQFIPYPATWLRSSGWENDVGSMNSGKGAGNESTHYRSRDPATHYRSPDNPYGGTF